MFVLSITRVASVVREQSVRPLHQLAKNQAMSIYERLVFMDARLDYMTSRLEDDETDLDGGRFAESLDAPLKGLWVVRRNEAAPELAGLGRLDIDLSQLREGTPLLQLKHSAAGSTHLLLLRAFSKGAYTAIAELDPRYLFWGAGSENTLPSSVEMLVLDESREIIFGTLSPTSTSLAELTEATTPTLGRIELGGELGNYMGRFWRVPLRGFSGEPALTVVMASPVEEVEAPLAQFRRTYLLCVLFAIWLVLLLSLSQIRRSLSPLKSLQQGTNRIAAGDFETRVDIRTGNELEELAVSFNGMAQRLGHQFRALRAVREITEVVLSSPGREAIVEAVLGQIDQLLACQSVSVALMDERDPSAATVYRRRSGESGTLIDRVQVDRSAVESLSAESFHVLNREEMGPAYTALLGGDQAATRVILPVSLGNSLSALIGLGLASEEPPASQDIELLLRISDHVAVALARLKSISDLDALSWGTLRALARTVDTKSKWTMGHSERVASVARDIGQAMGLAENELELLYRGGLLHDIGKIGVPASILDKPGPLTAEERAVVQEHVRYGIRILEPIEAFKSVLPMVWEHHEWINGNGYPRGLAGDAISLYGRILAVADVFDSMTSARPYRPPIPQDEVLEKIEAAVGSHFAPEVVTAFLAMIRKESVIQPHPILEGTLLKQAR